MQEAKKAAFVRTMDMVTAKISLHATSIVHVISIPTIVAAHQITLQIVAALCSVTAEGWAIYRREMTDIDAALAKELNTTDTSNTTQS